MRVSFEINLLCDEPGCDGIYTSDPLEAPEIGAAMEEAALVGWHFFGNPIHAVCPIHAKTAAIAMSR